MAAALFVANRRCEACGIEKPIEMFQAFRGRLPSGRITEGRRYKCRPCKNAATRPLFVDAACPSCGRVRPVRADTFKKTKGKCTACARREHKVTKARSDKKHPAHGRWASMIKRVRGDRAYERKYYKDRGIGVCDEWLDPLVFCAWADSSGYAPHLTLDRIDNDRGYSPENCRWTDWVTQSRNRRSSVRVQCDDGRVFESMAEAAEALGTSHDRVYKSLRFGWACFGFRLTRLARNERRP